ncbi:MAG: glutamate formimidoyltransferase [Vicinamibacterales bacterium]|nr:glutamate formimidoyltransferase [Vicinamibacterales bacterium]
MPLVECVPNVSEGRDPGIINALGEALEIPGVQLLDRSSDPSHNRTVYTFVGEPDRLLEAAIRLFEAAIERIDLRQHEGVHPRIGAVDVCPFVPMADTRMADCVALARSTAELVATRFQVPVYLYEEAARRPDRRNLADIRRGGLRDLELRMGEVAWLPDFGRPTLHPTAGATAIGARPILVAYNVNLESDRLDVARRIASVIRESGGGFASVKAMGVRLHHRGIVQVSMNLSDYRRTSMTTVFDAISREAALDGVEVLESEIVGLVPPDALPPDPLTRLRLAKDHDKKILNFKS